MGAVGQKVRDRFTDRQRFKRELQSRHYHDRGSSNSYGDGCPFASAKAPKERGWGMDPYGNLFVGSCTSGQVHIYCNAVSPLCPIAAGVTQTYTSAQKQVGYEYRIAGCVPGGAGATSVTTVVAPGSGDGYFASSFWNLPGDVAAWGPSDSGFSATGGITGTAGICGTTTGEISGVRSVTADQYGNVYISDGTNYRARVIVGPPTFTLPSGTVLTNPLPSVIKLYPAYSGVTAAQMHGRIYPMVGGFPPPSRARPALRPQQRQPTTMGMDVRGITLRRGPRIW